MALNRPKRLKEQTPSHARAKVQEKKAAIKIGGRLTPGSGNKYQKGDVRKRGIMRIECKTTKNKSYSVTTATLEKLEDAVFGTDEIPVLEIELQLGKQKFYVLPASAMDWILENADASDR